MCRVYEKENSFLHEKTDFWIWPYLFGYGRIFLDTAVSFGYGRRWFFGYAVFFVGGFLDYSVFFGDRDITR